jgi:hypothetical protein
LGPDGKIYALGGIDYSQGADGRYSSVEVYDAAANAWSAAAPMSMYRIDFAAAMAGDGRLYSLGGTTASGASAAVEAYSLGAIVTANSTGGNHAPSFIAGPNQSATDQSGLQIFEPWATAISAGPPDESGQSLTFIVTTDNDALFSVKPAIDAAGKLTFTPAPNRTGTAVVTVMLHDSGGTANGGVDTSGPQTFNIVVTKKFVWHNAIKALDVTADTHVVAGDALEVINYINAYGSTPVPSDGRASGPYYDVNFDGFVAPSDVLDIINFINAYGPDGEGEPNNSAEVMALQNAIPQPATSDRSSLEELLSLLAFDVASQPRRRDR